jgi:four helix bundle protein
MTLELPGFEKFETGAQIRRSSKSVKSNIVEGYGRRRYKNEFIRFMIMSQASNDESIDHLETLYYTGSLKNEALYKQMRKDMIRLGKEINRFIQALETKHKSW